MHKLLREIVSMPNKGCCRKILQYRGIADDLTVQNVSLRANAFRSLLTRCPPFVYKNDLILGSMAGLFSLSYDEDEVNLAKIFVDNLGEREFIQHTDHYCPDYEKLLKVGVTGLLDEIAISQKKFVDDEQKMDTLNAMETCLKAYRDMLLLYGQTAKSLCGEQGYDDEILNKMALDAKVVAFEKPTTFRQALQLVWAWHLAFCLDGKYAMALGRMDQYLYPFYVVDKENGRITDDEALALFQATLSKIYEHRHFLGNDDVVNVCIAGVDENGNDATNELTYLIIEAVKKLNVPGPNLSARISAVTPDSLLDSALVSIGTGLGYPALISDEVNERALVKKGYDLKDVRNRSMVGCLENFFAGQQPPWADGRYNAPLCLDYVLFDGKSTRSFRRGVKTGNCAEIDTMDEFLRRFEIQLRHLADEETLIYKLRCDKINPVNYQEPFLSILCQDCIGRGLDVNMGGAKYPANYGLAVMGIATIADSLSAIEKVVFVDKEATLNQISDALVADFVGYERLQRLLLDAPKYGNNDDFVDKYAVWFARKVAKIFDDKRTPQGGTFFCGMASNVDNIYAGKEVGATADGRKAGTPLSDAASPAYGKDRRGATSTLNSLIKPDYTDFAVGSVINQKFTPEMFSDDEKRKKMLALVRTYFEGGGQELQINATSREILIDAMNNPEKHANLVVRVSGFSAHFVTLDRSVQEDILNRTQQR